MIFNNSENESVKLPDGRVVWLSRSCAVSAAIFADVVHEGTQEKARYVLLTQRGPECPDNVGKWVMPCGYLDRDEELGDAALREVFEETGLNLTELPSYSDSSFFLGQPIWVNSRPTGKQIVTHFFGIIFLVSPSGGIRRLKEMPVLDITKVKNPGEVSDMRWVPLQDIPNYDMAFNHEKRVPLLSNKL